MWRWLFVFLWPVVAFADPVDIRSGEHERFSRLVFTIEPETRWSLNPTIEGFTLSLDGERDGFDLTEVFDRIPRNRLVDLQQRSENALLLIVECECHADAFLWRPDRLVIDVIDGIGPSDALRKLENEPLSTEILGPIRQSPSSLPDILDLPEGLSLTASRGSEPLSSVGSTLQSSQPGGESATGIEVAEIALIEGLAQAANQGYLTSSDTNSRTRVGPPEPAQPPQNLSNFSQPVAPPSQLGIGLSTALDETLVDITERLNALEVSRCYDPQTFDLASWADDRSLHEQIAEMAEDLTGSFGSEPVQAQTRLAKLYLHYGFGAEALLVLRADRSASQIRSVLIELASLIDDYPGPFPLTASQGECDTDGAFWAILAGAKVPETDVGRNHILRTFFEIPQPLRGHLAPRVSTIFLNGGYIEEAERSLQSTIAPDIQETDVVQTSRADLATAQGASDEALRILRKEVHENPRVTPRAVIELIDLTLANGQLPTDAELLVASGLADDYRDRDIFIDLRRAQARGHSARQSFAKALGLLSDLEPDAVIEDVSQIYADIAKTASSTDFLDFAFKEVPDFVSDETINYFGERLIDLGFPERASSLLARPAKQNAAAERRYLRAEAALATLDFQSVIDELQGITTDRARRLRSEAYDGLGEYRTALSEGASTPSEIEQIQQFRAEAWDRLSLGEDEVLANFARARLNETSAADATTLTDRQALIERSQESRQAIQSLLQQFSDPAIAQ